MTIQSIILILLLLTTLTLLAFPLGRYLAYIAVSRNKIKVLSCFENFIYKISGINNQEMNWKQYAFSVVLFNVLGIVILVFLQLLQPYLFFNQNQAIAPNLDLSVNTAVSFVTNTNWQAYSGETGVSYLVQMLGLTVQNFLSAATGIAVVFAVIRGISSYSQTAHKLGNFWIDITRIVFYVLLPLSIIVSLIFISQGVIQNFLPPLEINTLEGGKQVIAMGPNASQEAIKLIGTNGGGFFNANSSHPFSNPNILTNFIQMLCIFLIPAALCIAFGHLVGDKKQGLAIYVAMIILFIIFASSLLVLEQQVNPAWQSTSFDTTTSTLQTGSNIEGKELRFGISGSALFSAVTTAASCGAVNNMHDSLMPLSGGVTMLLMQLGEVVFGGVGSGLYGMLIFIILTVFIAGLMIGRSPEYLGKKIEPKEMKLIALAMLVSSFIILIFTAISTIVPQGIAGISNPGTHGFSQILYAFSSAVNNNGSAFAGLSANSQFYNYLLALAMFAGRFGVIIPMLAIAGAFAMKKRIPFNDNMLPTHSPLFIGLLICIVLIIGALTYVPTLVLGPIVEHVQLMAK
ncbi:potassium-transporting ATPase subunit KdpA [Commensalibacter nepenthis]|uniref:Potassium-transporting ATPase potassium-binding subunit n=1 Tax=Commensalibacter nepenthis TaxID=3043872 RepID=A0ABT6Q4H9_9PROT|nr:potassium-transporting ATPase subunit KdpA [Commensalibacter sp. TBRC 10068]MDI2111804.1 potassium-transporting ATPase subunit KdpA [Commensalibacter sp. TBRC 10068]